MHVPELFEPRVLVADDDQAIRQLLMTIMRREHLAVDAVVDGEEAIAKLKMHEYTVILLDLMMPRVDGFGVIDYLVQHPPQHKPVVLVISAYSDQKFKQVDPNVVSGVLRKPFEVADLGAIVHLCATGYDAELTHHLALSNDPAIRKLASQNASIISRARNFNGSGTTHN
jgi:CheY-like chemotaxis protein